MNKDETVKKLRELGFDADIEDNAVCVFNSSMAFEELKKILERIGYNASYGLKGSRK